LVGCAVLLAGPCHCEDAGVRLSARKLRGENRGGKAPSRKIQEEVQVRPGEGKTSFGYCKDRMQQRRACKQRGKVLLGALRRFSLYRRGETYTHMNKYLEVVY